MRFRGNRRFFSYSKDIAIKSRAKFGHATFQNLMMSNFLTLGWLGNVPNQIIIDFIYEEGNEKKSGRIVLITLETS